MHKTYIPKGVCSKQIDFDIEDGEIHNLTFQGGCNGNLKGIAALVEGQDINVIKEKLKDIKCGSKETSCPAQLAIALEKIDNEYTSATIDKVGGIILKDKKILIQRKQNDREECIIPGGKRKGNETDLETLKRELKEELDVELIDAEFIGEYSDKAVFSNKIIYVQAYLVKVEGKIKPQNEIKEALWIDRNYASNGIKVGSILGKYIIPKLIEKGLM